MSEPLLCEIAALPRWMMSARVICSQCDDSPEPRLAVEGMRDVIAGEIRSLLSAEHTIPPRLD